MGLDNGLILVTTNKIQMDELPEYIAIEDNNWRNENEKYNEGYYYDICYWRKWWKLRHFILSLDNIEKGKVDDEYIYGKNDLFALVIIMKQMLRLEEFRNMIGEIGVDFSVSLLPTTAVTV